MKRLYFRPLVVVLALVLAHSAAATEQPEARDLRRAVPQDAFLAVYAQHNPERDFQREYYREVWNTVQETQIIERAVKIVTDRIGEEDLEKAKAVLDELRDAAEPIDVEAILNCKQFVYAQFMQFPSAQHLFMIRVTPEASPARNPAFDVTPAELVTAIITEKGVFRPQELAEKETLLRA